MAKIGVCIEPFFSDLPYRDRIRKVKELGYSRYEFWFHDKRFDGAKLVDERKDFDEIAELNQELGLSVTDFVFNHPDGGVVRSLVDPRDRDALVDSLPEIAALARKVGCRRLISGTGNRIAGISHGQAVENITKALRRLAPVCAREGITLILEPFNTRVDHPDYFLDDPHVALKILKDVDSPNVRMLYDMYHMQIMAGNLTAFIREHIEWIGHFHVAGVPGRHEPDDNELNYRFLVEQIDETGYDGGIGLEYWPTMASDESLKRTRKYLGA